MGASPKHKLSPPAAELLEWLNTPRDQIPSPTGPRVIWEDVPSGQIHSSDNTLIKLHEVLYQGLEMLSQLGTRRGPAKTVLKRLLTDLADQFPAIPQKLTFDHRGPHFIPAPERLRGNEPWLHRFAWLLEDVWGKGYKRLKKCEWSDCNRFFWDPTNNREKDYCDSRHDKARARLRARRSP